MTDFLLPSNTKIEKFTPVGGMVLILPTEKDRSKLIVSSDRWSHESFKGTILKTAEGVDDLRPGMEVLFSPYSHRSLDLNGQLLFIVHASDVVAILPPKAEVRSARLRSPTK